MPSLLESRRLFCFFHSYFPSRKGKTLVLRGMSILHAKCFCIHRPKGLFFAGTCVLSRMGRVGFTLVRAATGKERFQAILATRGRPPPSAALLPKTPRGLPNLE